MKKTHYGWVIVWITFFAILIAAGIRSVSSVILLPLELEFEWTRSSISLAFAINLTLYGFLGPFIAAAMEKIGITKMMIYGMVLLVLGMVISLIMSHIWQLYLIWGIMIGFGCGVFLTVLAANVANNWFEERRGFVIGLLMASTAAGQVLFLPLLSYLSDVYSWRIGISMFLILGLLIIPLVAIWMKDSPKDKGLLPYGATDIPHEKDQSKNPIKEAFNVLGLGVRSVPFWILALSFFICGFSTVGLISTHFIPASSHHGIPEVHAASLLAFMGIFNIIGTMASGWLSDRFDNRWLLFWYYGLRGLSLLVLPYALGMNSYVLLIAFAVFYGLDWIATVPPTIRLASYYFGKEQGVIIYGWVFAAHQVGAGVAAFLGGYFFEIFDGYTITFLTAGLLCIMATLFVIMLKKKATVEEAARSIS
ncbi:MFS transporter [Halalkalibacter krulwichiae]|uniref:Putative MFS-type transporter YhjX n=1 Tax=Halalkalibacter krulwichiae TaxID=199441 RepID=A0A1X9MIG0_9BACI|nr:MFS transporter [Halalkalibacter krulwichiae]ARK32500.1 putative MFS-type transporter YhjX [Halalkalibacter krulwichiae]